MREAHASASRLIVTLRVTMIVTRRETIKRFARACKGEALDCNPKGYHARAEPLILCFAQAWLSPFAYAWSPFACEVNCPFAYKKALVGLCATWLRIETKFCL